MDKTKISVWPGYAGFLWAFSYAVFVRFYQAAGGTIGIPGQLENPEGFFMVSYIAGVLILFCGFVLLALVKPWGKAVPTRVPFIGGRRVPPFLLLIPTLIGSAFAIAHGVSGVMTKSLQLAGAITIHYQGWISIDVHRLILWDIMVYEPWFIIMGILAGLAAFRYAQASGISRPVRRRSAFLFMSFVVSLTALFIFAIIFDFLKFG